ncbi:MAG TPA: serine hydrolase domain-containing protein [Aridibacter sp.]|nr:serine hydrolase domain-containing protein [Aridibacter sp.]
MKLISCTFTVLAVLALSVQIPLRAKAALERNDPDAGRTTQGEPVAASGRGSAAADVLYGKGFDRSAFEAQIDRIMREQMDKLSIPGASVSVVKNGEIVYRKGFGFTDVERSRPVSADSTIFRIGSITKVFTAAALLQLADSGKIDLDADVNKYLKKAKVPETYPVPVTGSALLTHSAGLDEVTPERRTSDRSKLVPLGDFLSTRIVRRLPPGLAISYSTYNAAVAGLIVEDVTGRSLHDHFQTEIFKPLGMNRSSLADVPEKLRPDFAQGYEVDDGKPVPLPFQWFKTYPASDINSTSSDMARFLIAILGEGAVKETRILSRESARAMQERQFSGHPEIGGYTYGLQEWERQGVRWVEHGGSMDDGYSALLAMIPSEEFGFFVACNTEGGGFGLGNSIKNMILDKYFPAKPVTTTETYPSKPGELARFAGKYQNDIYCHSCGPDSGAYKPNPFEVAANDDGTLSFWGAKWRKTGPMLFELAEGPRAGQVNVAFREDEKKRITHFFQEWSTFERVP